MRFAATPRRRIAPTRMPPRRLAKDHRNHRVAEAESGGQHAQGDRRQDPAEKQKEAQAPARAVLLAESEHQPHRLSGDERDDDVDDGAEHQNVEAGVVPIDRAPESVPTGRFVAADAPVGKRTTGAGYDERATFTPETVRRSNASDEIGCGRGVGIELGQDVLRQLSGNSLASFTSCPAAISHSAMACTGLFLADAETVIL